MLHLWPNLSIRQFFTKIINLFEHFFATIHDWFFLPTYMKNRQIAKWTLKTFSTNYRYLLDMSIPKICSIDLVMVHLISNIPVLGRYGRWTPNGLTELLGWVIWSKMHFWQFYCWWMKMNACIVGYPTISGYPGWNTLKLFSAAQSYLGH